MYSIRMRLFTEPPTKSDSTNLPLRQGKTMKNTQTARAIFVFASFVCLCFHKMLSRIHCHHNYRLAKMLNSPDMCGGGANAYYNHNGDIISGVTAFAYLLFCLSHHLCFFSVLFFVFA